MDREQADVTVAIHIVRPKRSSGTGWRHKQNVEVVARGDESVMKRKAVDEDERRVLLHDGRQIASIDFGQLLVRRAEHNDVGVAGRR
jgi:hypothetical protein